MSKYDQWLQDKSFMRAIHNAVPNSAELFPRNDFLKRFEENIEARNRSVDEQVRAREANRVSAA
jgi:hypothetical protein